MRDLYEILGVDRRAGPAELKKAYYRIAKRYHPDRNPGDREAEARFKEASGAYAVLSDDDQRRRYDTGATRTGAGADGPAGEDPLSSYADFFRGRARRDPGGLDLRVDLELTFAEAVWGATRDVQVTHEVACAACSGSGARCGDPEDCRTCRGGGQVLHAQGFFMVQAACPHCRGAGRVVRDPCGDCRGRGLRPRTSTLSVTVPAGVDDGQVLRVADRGQAAPDGATGHLYVALRVQGDRRFRRDGEDVLTEVRVGLAQAVLGGEVVVPTLDERCTGTVTVEIDPGTQPGQTIVRRGQGVPRVREGGRGDHVLQVRVDVPRAMTPRQEELARELAAELGEAVRSPASTRRSSREAAGEAAEEADR